MAAVTYSELEQQAQQTTPVATNIATAPAPAVASVTPQATTAPATTYTDVLNAGNTATIINDNGEKQTATVAGTEATNAAIGNQATDTEQQLSYWQQQKNLYNDMYKQQVAYNNQAAADAASRAAQLAQQNIDNLNKQWSGTNKQLYRDYMENQRVTPQKLAAMGYSGGLSETSLLRLANAYQEALQQNEANRLGNVAAINAQQAQSDYEAQAAAAEANNSALQNLNQYLAALQEQQRQEAQTRAETLAATGDFSGYLELGYSQDDVDYMTRLWLKQNPNYLATWIKGHQADADRMGIKMPTSTTTGSNGQKYGYFDENGVFHASAADRDAANLAIAKGNAISQTFGNSSPVPTTIIGTYRPAGRI